MKSEEINNLLINSDLPTLGTEVYVGKTGNRTRCSVVGIYDSKTPKGFLPIIRATNSTWTLAESATFNTKENMIFAKDALLADRTSYRTGDKAVLSDEFITPAEYSKETDKRIVDGLVKLNLKIGDLIAVEKKGNDLRWDRAPTIDLSLEEKSFTIIGLDWYGNPVVSYEKGWNTKNEGLGKIHSSYEKEVNGWSIKPEAIITKEMHASKVDAQIVKKLETTKFKLGQKVYVSRFNAEKEISRDAWTEPQRANKNNYGDKKDYLEGVVAGYDGHYLIIKNQEKLGRYADDIGYYGDGDSRVHSSLKQSSAGYILATPLAAKTEEDFENTVEVGGNTYKIGAKMFACQLNTGLTKILYAHNNYIPYSDLIHKNPECTMGMAEVIIVGKSGNGQLIVEYNGQKEYVNYDAVFSTDSLPPELVKVEKIRNLSKAGFSVGDPCKFVSANRQQGFIARQRLPRESDEQYAEYFDGIGCELIWQMGTIRGADENNVQLEFTGIDGKITTDTIPISQIGSIFTKPSAGFAKVMARQKLRKMGKPIGSKCKLLVFPTVAEGTWRNHDMSSYVEHMKRRNAKPAWVEAEVVGMDEFDNVSVSVNGADPQGSDIRAIFDLDADFPEVIKKAFETPVNAFVSKVKLEGTSAGYRIASMQLTAMVRRTIITLLQKTNNEKLRVISSALDTEIGKAIVGGAIGVLLLQYYPTDERAQRLAEEFRINALATVGNEAIEALIGGMMPALIETFSSLPDQERIQILKETTTEFSGILSEPEEETYIKEKIANG